MYGVDNISHSSQIKKNLNVARFYIKYAYIHSYVVSVCVNSYFEMFVSVK